MKILILALLLLATACATSPVTKEQKEKISDVTIVSLLGDNVQLITLGTSSLQNKEHSLALSQWKIDDQLSSFFAAQLRAAGKNTITQDKSARATFFKLRKAGSTTVKNIFGGSDDELQKAVFADARSRGAGYVFLITPLERDDNFPKMRGPAGFFCRDSSLGDTDPVAYLIYHAALWDVDQEKKVFQNAISPSEVSVKIPMKCHHLANLTDAEIEKKLRAPLTEALRLSAKLMFIKSGLTKSSSP